MAKGELIMKQIIKYIGLLFLCGCATLGKSVGTVNDVYNHTETIRRTTGVTLVGLLKGAGLLLSFIVAVYLFKVLKSFIMKTAKSTVKVKVTGKKTDEPFSWTKFKKIFNISSGAEWAKSIKEILDARKLLIYGTIIASIYGFAYYQGRVNQVVKVDFNFEKSYKVKINGHFLVKPRNANHLEIQTADGRVLKVIRAKDMPDLAKKLKPIGFLFEPIGVVGVGTDGFEGGVGVSWLKMWKYRMDTFLTQKGIYLGTSYKLQWLKNSAVGIGIGKGYEDLENRAILYWRVEF